jgi:hypothetical protein
MTEVQQMDAQEIEVAANDTAYSSQPPATAEDIELINKINTATSIVLKRAAQAATCVSNFSKMLVEDDKRVVCIRKQFRSLGEYLRKIGK